jgi:hypothetical protein
MANQKQHEKMYLVYPDQLPLLQEILHEQSPHVKTVLNNSLLYYNLQIQFSNRAPCSTRPEKFTTFEKKPKADDFVVDIIEEDFVFIDEK